MMSTGTKRLLGGLFVAAMMCSTAAAQDAADLAAQTQAKLLARRAAQADCYRLLAEQVKGLRITSDTYVKDFVAESDTIATSVNTFIRGCKPTGERFMEDGTCEMTMELPLSIVEAELTSIHKATYKGDKYKISDIQNLHVTNKVAKISVTGNGAPRPIQGVEVYGEDGQPMRGVGLALPNVWKQVSPQARLMAKRAATVDAYRNLAEQVKGLRIRSDTLVRDFVAESDQIATSLNTWLQGAKVGEVRYLDDLRVEVDVRVALQSVITELRREHEAYYKGNRVKVRDFEEMKQTVKIDWVTATGTGVPKVARPIETTAVTAVTAAPAQAWPEMAIAKGNGIRPDDAENPAQAKLMAIRAAKLDAYRNLTEEIKGLRIDANTLVRDFVAANDTVRTSVNDWIQGVKTIDERYDPQTGEAQVTVQAPLDQLRAIVLKYRSEVNIEIRR